MLYKHSYILNDITNNTNNNNEDDIEKAVDLSLQDSLYIIQEKKISNTNELELYYEYQFEDLLKYSKYRVYLVTVFNAKLTSEPSSSILIYTSSDVPDAAPDNVLIDILNATSIRIKWKPPSIDTSNGIIIGYKISIKENDKQLININVDNKSDTKIINNLNSGKKYSLRIAARTVNGSGPASNWVIAQTYLTEMDETKVPGEPVELFSEASDRSIKLHWLPPIDSNKTIIRKYLLKYGIFIPETTIEIDGKKDSYLIENLSK